MKNNNSLILSITQTVNLNNGSEISPDKVADEVFALNGLFKNGYPDWLLILFDALLTSQKVSRTEFKRSANVDEDVFSLFYILEKMMNNVEIEDEGEYAEVYFKNLGMAIMLRWEDWKYEVYKVPNS